MNISNNPSVSFAASGIGLDAEGRLALMVLEQQQTQEDSARTDKSLARERYVEASNDEVEAMRDKAGHLLVGAFVQGAATATASGIQMGDAIGGGESKGAKASADFGHGTAPVLGRAFGDSPAAADDANAKHAASLAEQARWQLEDANKVIDESEKTQDKALDWVSSVDANQASAETGIIAGLA
ncbi:MAG: hypothetical protein EOO73_35420 [Myxococcales bacterium]|nr:MAG: hypothetical protein EOO73_35420 [Myxococcales bacterium]